MSHRLDRLVVWSTGAVAVAFALWSLGPVISAGRTTFGSSDGGIVSIADWHRIVDGALSFDPPSPETLAVFFTYSCSFCREQERQVERLRLSRSRDFTVVYRMFVPSRGSERTLSLGAYCAARLGQLKSYHESTVRRSERPFSEEEISAWVSAFDSSAAFAGCLRSDWASRRLAADDSLVARFRLRITPTTISRHRTVWGVVQPESLLRNFAK